MQRGEERVWGQRREEKVWISMSLVILVEGFCGKEEKKALEVCVENWIEMGATRFLLSIVYFI